MHNYIKKTKRCVDFHKDVWIFTKMCPTGHAKNMFHLVDFLVELPEHTKSTEIDRCTGVP